MDESAYEIQFFTNDNSVFMRIIDAETKVLLAEGEGRSRYKLKQKLLKDIADSKREFVESMK